MIKKFLRVGQPGIYFRVKDEGVVGPGDSIAPVHADENRVSLTDIFRLIFDRHASPESLRRTRPAVPAPGGGRGARNSRRGWCSDPRLGMAKRTLNIRLKRAYEPASHDDGVRILVERLWPRGLTKEKAAIDHWAKELSPSPDLRNWYGHDPTRWDEFRERYRAELEQKSDLIDDLKERVRSGPVTFIYAAKDEEHNSALVLMEYLQEKK